MKRNNSYWEDRVLEMKYTTGGYYYEIIEVYYKNGKIVAWSEPRTPYGESVKDLKLGLKLMFLALKKPVLREIKTKIGKLKLVEIEK